MEVITDIHLNQNEKGENFLVVDRTPWYQTVDLGTIIFIGTMVLFLLFMTAMISHGVGYSDGREVVQKEAVSHKYAEYDESQRFIWKDDLEKQRFLEDLDFIKRHERMFVPSLPGLGAFGPLTSDPPIPKIDPTQDF